MTNIKLPGKQSSILWHASDFAIKLGVTRLIAFPIIARTLSTDSFGAFVTAMSVAFVLGGALTTAYGNYILKTLGEWDDSTRASASLYLSIKSIFSTCILFAALIALLWILPLSFTSGHFWWWLTIFALHYIMSVQAETLLSTLRVSRKFKTLASTHCLGVFAMLIVLTIPGFSGEIIVSISIVVWSAIPMLTSLYLHRSSLATWKFANLPAKSSHHIFHFFIGGIAITFAEYIDRLLLALWWPAETVSVFFAASSLAMLMSAPSLIVATYILSLLAKISFSTINNSKYFLGYFGFVIAVCLLIYITGQISGDYLLKRLYPNQYADASLIFQACLSAAALLSCSTLLKPVVTRYHLTVLTPVVSSFSLVLRTVIAYHLIKNNGLAGASQALVYGSAITSTVWGLSYFSLLSGKQFQSRTNG